MYKVFTLFVCAMMYYSVNAKVSSIFVHTTDGKIENFVLNESTRLRFEEKDFSIIYPGGEYSLEYDNLKKIEYSDFSNVNNIKNEPTYCFADNQLTIDAATEDLEIALFNIRGDVVCQRKVRISESTIIDFSGFKGVYVLKINSMCHKLLLK